MGVRCGQESHTRLCEGQFVGRPLRRVPGDGGCPGRAVEREREAIRILKPQGRDAFCEVSYDETEKINYFRAWTIANDFDITLPEGLTVDEVPDPVNLDLDFASYRSTITVKGNLLHYEREYIVRQVEIPGAQAATFRKLQNAILNDEKGTVVLKKG